MTRNLFKLSLIAGVSAAAVLTACGGGGGDGGQGTLKVSLTDAPACGYDAVNVTVNKVRVHRSDGAGENDGGWSDIVISPARKINLLDLTNGVLSELGQVSLPAGRYTQIRLVLDPNNGNGLANSVVLSGTTNEIPLDTPSAVQSGIKLIKGFDVVAGQQAELVLDFDACKSVVTKGNGKLALKPVVKIIPSTANGIEGHVNTALLANKVMVTAQQNGEVIRATTPDASGKFFLARLEPGEYDVVITADERATAVIAKVPVTSSSKVPLTTSDKPVDLQASAAPDLGGTVSPVSSTEEVAFVVAKQSFSAGPTVTVKFGGADLSDGKYTLPKLPTAAPQLGQYSTTLPITLTTQTTTTPGTGKYTVEASRAGYQPQSATVDMSSAPPGTPVIKDFTLTK